MPVRTTPYPLPDAALSTLPPAALGQVGVSIVRRIYGIELETTPCGLARLDALVRERLRPGRYTPADYPTMLALSLGAQLGLTLQQLHPGGQWGESGENLYRTPLPFLLYARSDHARQINVVEDFLTFMWSGDGLYPADYVAYYLQLLARLGFTCA